MPAMRAENDIVRLQVRADTNRHRLLANVGVAGSRDQPALVGLDELLLGAADLGHAFVKRQADSPGWQFDCFAIF
jgi:hypothetical protein